MTSSNFKMEVLSGLERRRRWSTAEKLAIIQETYEADVTVSIAARRHGRTSCSAWRKLAFQGPATRISAMRLGANLAKASEDCLRSDLIRGLTIANVLNVNSRG